MVVTPLALKDHNLKKKEQHLPTTYSFVRVEYGFMSPRSFFRISEYIDTRKLRVLALMFFALEVWDPWLTPFWTLS